MPLSTRMHGAIDYGVAACLAGLAATAPLPAAVRRVLGAAAASHVGYAAITNYEAGLTPMIDMPTHLVLDGMAAIGLCVAGLSMRRQPPAARALLVAIGLAELAVVSVSSAAPLSGPGQGGGALARVLGVEAPASYPPLETPKAVADGVWVVDSTLQGAMAAILPVRMTILRLTDGGLLLYSPTRFSYELKQRIDALGTVAHLVAPNLAHWMFLEAWQRSYPAATSWAARGLRQRQPQLRLDRDLAEPGPAEWGGVRLIDIPGGMNFQEAALFHDSSRTLVLADTGMNLEGARMPSALQPLAKMLGMLDAQPPPWLRALVKVRGRAAREARQRLLRLGPQRVIVAHGDWERLTPERALRWI